jgi:hypothetical protein
LVSWIPSACDINNKPTLSNKGSTNQRVTCNGMHFCLVSSTFSDDSQVGEDETIGIAKGESHCRFQFLCEFFHWHGWQNKKPWFLSKIGSLDGWELFLLKSWGYNFGLDVSK